MCPGAALSVQQSSIGVGLTNWSDTKRNGGTVRYRHESRSCVIQQHKVVCPSRVLHLGRQLPHPWTEESCEGTVGDPSGMVSARRSRSCVPAAVNTERGPVDHVAYVVGMLSHREQPLSGLAHLEAVTALLQRIRSAHPTAGLWEAADRQWSWRTPRSTDDLLQLYWFDDDGEPVAAVIMTDSVQGVGFDPIFMPDTTPAQVAHVVDRGLGHAAECGIDEVHLEVDRTDDVLRGVLFDHGFTVKEDGAVEAWLSADARPEISPIPEQYRLSARADSMRGPHHMTSAERNHPDIEERLQQTSLYRSDLDLVVHDPHGSVAAYGLFWHDPATATGLVEPMRTEDDHQRRGLARHVLTAGVGLLVWAGAERIKIVYDPANPASGHLYRSVGFEPHRHTDLLAGPTKPQHLSL